MHKLPTKTNSPSNEIQIRYENLMFDSSIRRGSSLSKRPPKNAFRIPRRTAPRPPKPNMPSKPRKHFFLGRKKKLLKPVLKELDRLDAAFGRQPASRAQKELKVVELQWGHEAGQENLPEANYPRARTSFVIKRQRPSRRVGASRVAEKPLAEQIQQILDSPRAGPGKRHFNGMTDKYLEVLSDKKQVASACCQTENLISKVVHTSKLKKETGVDAWTQVAEGDPFLFDFEEEVGPVIRVLVNRTLERARMEVLEEEELILQAAEKRRLDGEKKRFMNEIQRITIKEHRLQEERKWRKNQVVLTSRIGERRQEKHLCQRVGRLCVDKLYAQRRDKLSRLRFFEDRRVQRIRKGFLRELVAGSEARVIRGEGMRYLMQQILFEATEQLKKVHTEAMRKMQGRKGPKAHSMTPSEETEQSEEIHVDSEQLRRMAKAYTKRGRGHVGLTLGDSFGLFSMFTRDLRQREELDKEQLEKTVAKTRAAGQLKASKKKARNPENFGNEDNPRVCVRQRLFPSVPVRRGAQRAGSRPARGGPAQGAAAAVHRPGVEWSQLRNRLGPGGPASGEPNGTRPGVQARQRLGRDRPQDESQAAPEEA